MALCLSAVSVRLCQAKLGRRMSARLRGSLGRDSMWDYTWASTTPADDE